MAEHNPSEPMIEETLTGSADRQPWERPTLTDLGAVSEVTQGISYTPGDGLTNLTP